MPEFSAPVPLSPAHDLSAFDCGTSALNDFLQRHALDKQNARLSRTYVVASGSRAVAYYTLAHVAVSSEDTPKRFGRGMPREIPAMLMARLAVDLSAQGRGLGRSLFTDALQRT